MTWFSHFTTHQTFHFFWKLKCSFLICTLNVLKLSTWIEKVKQRGGTWESVWVPVDGHLQTPDPCLTPKIWPICKYYHSKLLDCQECQSEFLWNRQSSIHNSVCAVADGNLTEGCISARAVSALSVPNTLLETPGLKAQLSSDALCVSWWIFIFISLFFLGHIGFLVPVFGRRCDSSLFVSLNLCLFICLSLSHMDAHVYMNHFIKLLNHLKSSHGLQLAALCVCWFMFTLFSK